MSTRYYTRIYCNDKKIASIGVPDNDRMLVMDDFGFNVESKYDILKTIIDRMLYTFKYHECGTFKFKLELVRRNTSRSITIKYDCPYIVYKDKDNYWLISERHISSFENSFILITKEWIQHIALAGCELIPAYYIKRIK